MGQVIKLLIHKTPFAPRFDTFKMPAAATAANNTNSATSGHGLDKLESELQVVENADTGNGLPHIDPILQKKLLRKIDWHIIVSGVIQLHGSEQLEACAGPF